MAFTHRMHCRTVAGGTASMTVCRRLDRFSARICRHRNQPLVCMPSGNGTSKDNLRPYIRSPVQFRFVRRCRCFFDCFVIIAAIKGLNHASGL